MAAGFDRRLNLWECSGGGPAGRFFVPVIGAIRGWEDHLRRAVRLESWRGIIRGQEAGMGIVVFFFMWIVAFAVIFLALYKFGIFTRIFLTYGILIGAYVVDTAIAMRPYWEIGGEIWKYPRYPFLINEENGEVEGSLYCGFLREIQKKDCEKEMPFVVSISRGNTLFHRYDVFVYNNGEIILYGFKNLAAEIWDSEGLLGFRMQFFKMGVTKNEG